MKRVLSEVRVREAISLDSIIGEGGFTAQVEFRGTPEIVPAPCSNVKDEHQKQPQPHDALRLKLSL